MSHEHISEIHFFHLGIVNDRIWHSHAHSGRRLINRRHHPFAYYISPVAVSEANNDIHHSRSKRKQQCAKLKQPEAFCSTRMNCNAGYTTKHCKKANTKNQTKFFAPWHKITPYFAGHGQSSVAPGRTPPLNKFFASSNII